MTFRLFLSILLLIPFVVLFAIGTRNMANPGRQEKLFNFRKFSYIPLGLSAFFLLLSCLRVVNPGEVGIPVVFGEAKSPIQSGIAFTNPFADVKHFSIRTEEYTMSAKASEGNKNGDDSVQVLGKDGATGKVDATLLYHLNKSDASRVYKELGVNYVDKIIRPTSRTCIRNAFADVDMVAAATTERAAVAASIESCIEGKFKNLGTPGLVLESFQLRDVSLSETVQNAINAKVEAEQRANQQIFELDKTRQQAEIRRVEAEGLADSQRIIQSTLTPAYLQYEYIKAMQNLVNAPNNSTLVLPMDSDLSPQFILPPNVK